MLDSLVRVSRRVTASTDLLGGERPTATEALLAVQVGHMPVGPKARTPGADSGEKTSSEAFGPVPTVPTVTPGEVAPVERPGIQHPVIADLSTRAGRTQGWVHQGNFEEGCVYCHTVSRTLNSLFKVLFKFPSLYLFSIGLGVIFSLTRSLPRTLGCTPKQPDSREKVSENGQPPYGPITLYGQWPLSSWTLTGCPVLEKTLPNATFHEAKMTCGSAMPCSRFIRHY